LQIELSQPYFATPDQARPAQCGLKYHRANERSGVGLGPKYQGPGNPGTRGPQPDKSLQARLCCRPAQVRKHRRGSRYSVFGTRFTIKWRRDFNFDGGLPLLESTNSQIYCAIVRGIWLM